MPDIHPRKIIRAAVVTILIGTAPNYATAAGTRVKAARIPPFRVKKDLPAIAVYTGREQIVPQSHDTRPLKTERHVELVIDIYLDLDLTAGSIDTSALDEAFDAIALQVERAIENAEDTRTALKVSADAAGAAAWCRLDSTEVFQTELAEKPAGCIRLTYDAMYYGEPLYQTLEALTIADTHFSLKNAQAVADQAEDNVPLQTT